MNKKTNLKEAIEELKNNSKGIYFVKNEKENDFISYGELYHQAAKFLGLLQNRGLGKGDKLIFQFEENKPFILVFWACILGGIIPIPLALATQPSHKEKILNIIKLLNNPFIISDTLLDTNADSFLGNEQEITYSFIKFDELSEELKDPDNCPTGISAIIEQDDTAFIQFSSGSTSSPKGVVLTHRNLMCNINSILNSGHYEKNVSALSWMPLTHDMGLIGFHLTPLVFGIELHLMPTSLFIRHPVLWLKRVSDYRIAITSSPNFGLKYFMTYFKRKPINELDLNCLKVIYNGAEPISKDIVEEFLELLSKYGLKREAMLPVYGLAEASLMVTAPKLSDGIKYYCLKRDSLRIGAEICYHPDEVTFVEVGRPVEGVQIRIVDNDGRMLAEKYIGNIEIAGENVTRGYYNNPELTEKTITPDGWLRTGDLGFVIDGRLVVTGRKKDLLFVNGQNFYSHDLEKIAENVEGIESGKVVAISSSIDNSLEESFVFFIRYTSSDLTKFITIMKALKLHIFQKLGLSVSYIIPIRKIPETTSGKVQRFKLKEQFESGEFKSIIEQIQNLLNNENESRKFRYETNQTEKQLLSLSQEILGNKEFSIHDHFFEIGINSLDLIQIYQKIEMIMPGKITIADFFAYPSISQLSAFLDHKNIFESNSIAFSDEFYCASYNENNYHYYKFIIPEKLSLKLHKISLQNQVDLEDLFIVAYLYTLNNITSQTQIPLQLLIGDISDVHLFIFEMNLNDNLIDLVNVIHKKRITNNYNSCYKFSELNEKITKRQIKKSLILFHKNHSTLEKDLTTVFDIIIQLIVDEKNITILMDFNNLKMRSEPILNLFSNFVNLIEILPEKYDHLELTQESSHAK